MADHKGPWRQPCFPPLLYKPVVACEMSCHLCTTLLAAVALQLARAGIGWSSCKGRGNARLAAVEGGGKKRKPDLGSPELARIPMQAHI